LIKVKHMAPSVSVTERVSLVPNLGQSVKFLPLTTGFCSDPKLV